MPFDPVDPRQSFPELEAGILKYWQVENVFHRSITQRQDGEPFSFYDGPPFATGLPHYGHILAGTIKDVIPRFQTMRGKRVERRFGWDCHGLPVEYEIEKEHGIKSRRDIEAMGIGRFNELCRAIVQRYVQEWRKTVERTGRFVDMDHDYRTMDPDYMESIWWVFSELYAKGLLKEGYKPMHVCPRCATPLSNFEVTQGYKEIDDQTATVAFALTDEPGTSILAWTTTPWTLPGNLFLAVHPKTLYTKVEHNGKTYICAEPLLEQIFKGKEYVKKPTSFKGSTLVGRTYIPLFPYFAAQYKTAFRVVAGDFVTTEDGTGIVHIAPGFGEDDEAVGRREDVPILQHVTMDGVFVPAVTDFAGIDVKPKDDPSRTDKKIIAWLKEHGSLFDSASYRHSYPHCWRCESPLLNYATSSWFVSVEKIKKDMLAANAKTEWVPEHIRDGRFGKWLEGARDWAISRNRYWGTPLPVWRADDGSEMTVLRSRDDLRAKKPIRYTKVTAVRHGESLNNVAHVFEGISPGSALSATGKKQAADAGAFLKNQKVDVIYSSPMKRAMETAEAIAKATGATIIVDDRLIETQFGPHEGTAYNVEDLKAMKARRMAKAETRDTNGWHYLPGMEENVDVEKRISAFLRDILPAHRSKHLVVVTHGSPLTHLRGFFTQEDPYKLSVLPLPKNAEPVAFYWDHDAQSEIDLHKHIVDDVKWPATKPLKGAVSLTIVRHGETDWNRDKRIQGGGNDIPLNDTGRSQAEKLATTLKDEKFDAIVSSPMVRAMETAEILQKKLGLGEVVALEGLREHRMGEWEGQIRADVAQKLSTADDDSFALHPSTPEGGESLSQFLKRTEGTCEEILQKFAGKRVLVICHGGTARALTSVIQNLTYTDALKTHLSNCEKLEISLQPFIKRIPEVLDCWFESGSMPYAQQQFPFKFGSSEKGEKGLLPKNFPADFIAEGIDQTRGWFYTLTVLSAALFQSPAFHHCIVNGTILAEDGRKMSKRLKNYPDTGIVMEKHGADALRLSLMRGPAVHGEDMRFSEKTLEEALRAIILPLWNSYSFFVTYAQLGDFTAGARSAASAHPLDRWILAETQDLVNTVTEKLEAYDLATACSAIEEYLDALTNWYIRLSRRRFAGKGTGDAPEATPEQFEEDRRFALATLEEVLLTFSQLLAPFAPFTTEAIYLNLTQEQHASIHLTDWPEPRPLKKTEEKSIRTTRLLRRIVSLGMTIRSNSKVKVRTPLQNATIAYPPALLGKDKLEDEDRQLLLQELNVKDVSFTDDPGKLGERFLQVNARMVGPRLGGKVQEVIAAGKRGEFTVKSDGGIEILGETLTAEEAPVHYRGAEGFSIAAEGGIIVSLDTHVTDALLLEGDARELIRHIQQQRKDAGLSVKDQITLQIAGADALVKEHGAFIAAQTTSTLGTSADHQSTLELDNGSTVTITFHQS